MKNFFDFLNSGVGALSAIVVAGLSSTGFLAFIKYKTGSYEDDIKNTKSINRFLNKTVKNLNKKVDVLTGKVEKMSIELNEHKISLLIFEEGFDKIITYFQKKGSTDNADLQYIKAIKKEMQDKKNLFNGLKEPVEVLEKQSYKRFFYIAVGGLVLIIIVALLLIIYAGRSSELEKQKELLEVQQDIIEEQNKIRTIELENETDLQRDVLDKELELEKERIRNK